MSTALWKIATAVRSEAETYAREKGYDDESLVTMCSTVSAGLVIALRHHGIEARMVTGFFEDEGHFWAEVLGDQTTIVDLTATQFDIGAPAVVLTSYEEPFGHNYRRRSRAGSDIWACVQDHTLIDVAEFEARIRTWLKRAA